MRESSENPIIPDLPPEEEVHSSRYESSDLDIENLRNFLAHTKFEDEEAIKELLRSRYHMSAKEGLGEIEAGMTRIWNLNDIIDIVDPKGLLPRDAEKDREYLAKINAAMSKEKGHVLINGFGFFLNDDVKSQIRKSREGKPLSGQDPQAVMRVSLKTIDDKDLDLRIFKIHNRNQNFRYEYILEPK